MGENNDCMGSCMGYCAHSCEAEAPSIADDIVSVEGMKMLYIREAYFKLPDDFVGDARDALTLFAEYSKTHHDRATVYDATETDPYTAFIDLWPFDERKASAQMAIEVIKDGAWVEQKESL